MRIYGLSRQEWCRAGDAISIDYRSDHDVTIALVFRARMSDPSLLPQLLAADALSTEFKAYVRRRVASSGVDDS